MKSLYESMLDSVDQKMDKVETALIPSTIAGCLKKYFNEYLERMSDIKRVGQWYPLGHVDDDLYDNHDINKTEKFMISTIKQMFNEIKKVAKVPYIDVNADWKETFGYTYIKKYEVTFKKAGEEFVIEFTLHAKRNLHSQKVEYIDIWTKNKELAELI